MAKTSTERRISQRRRARGILVPLLEEILDNPQGIEDEKDAEFMVALMAARSREREKDVFSPSMLGSCVRQSYFARTGVERHRPKTPRSNGYFIDGDFRHYKWQFLLWKLHRAGLIRLLGVEVRVYHPSGDFAGTIDAIVEIDGEIFIIDFKGMNVNDFRQFEKYGLTAKHGIQIVGYAMILNSTGSFTCTVMGETHSVVIKRCILVGENKGGPSQSGSPIALHEQVIELSKKKNSVKKQTALLRRYVENEEIPPPECTSTKINAFIECPFSRLCREEVSEIQKQRERSKLSSGNTKRFKVEKSKRTRANHPPRYADGREGDPTFPDGSDEFIRGVYTQ